MNERLLASLNRLPRWKGIPVWALGLALVLIVLLALAVPALTGGTREASVWDGQNTTSTDAMLSGPGMALDITLKLGLIVIAIYVSMFALRRMQLKSGGRAARRMQLVETLHLNQKQALHLVRIGEQTLLIGATDQGISQLGELELPADSPDQSAEAPIAIPQLPGQNEFAHLFAKAFNRSQQ